VTGEIAEDIYTMIGEAMGRHSVILCTGDPTQVARAATEVVALYMRLDEVLTKGGQLPTKWQRRE
jgi:hypothetical protein